jgi:hypothetical protein
LQKLPQQLLSCRFFQVHEPTATASLLTQDVPYLTEQTLQPPNKSSRGSLCCGRRRADAALLPLLCCGPRKLQSKPYILTVPGPALASRGSVFSSIRGRNLSLCIISALRRAPSPSTVRRLLLLRNQMILGGVVSPASRFPAVFPL